MPIQMRMAMITSLQASLGDFTVSFQMMPQDSTLIIAVVRNKTQENFHVIIDREYISSQQEFFRSVFDEPQDVFEELIANFQELVIQDGLLKFSYNYGGLKKKKKIMSIDLSQSNSSNLVKKSRKSNKSIFKKQSTSMIQEKTRIEEQEQENNLEKTVERIINRLGLDKLRDEKNEEQKEKRKLLDQAIEKRINKINERIQDIEAKVNMKNESDPKEDKWDTLREAMTKMDKQLNEEIKSIKMNSSGLKEQNDSSIKEMKTFIKDIEGALQKCETQIKDTNLVLQSIKQQQAMQIKEARAKFGEQIKRNKEDAQKIKEKTDYSLNEMKTTVQNIQQLLQKCEAEIKDINSRKQVVQSPQSQVKQTMEVNAIIEGQIQTNKEYTLALKENTESSFKEMQTIIQKMEEMILKCQGEIKDTNSKLQAIQKQHQQAEQIRALQSRLYSQSVYQSLSMIKSQQDLHSQKLKQLDTIGHHFSNTHKQFYKLSNITNVSAKVTRFGQVGWYNFVNRFQIYLNHIVRFTIKINKLSKNALMVGFCSEEGLSKINNHQSLEAVYYNCSGYLLEDGASKFINVRFSSGDTIECYADLRNGRIVWLAKGHEITSCSIPKQMRNKPIFFSILMYWTNDEVDLFI